MDGHIPAGTEAGTAASSSARSDLLPLRLGGLDGFGGAGCLGLDVFGVLGDWGAAVATVDLRLVFFSGCPSTLCSDSAVRLRFGCVGARGSMAGEAGAPDAPLLPGAASVACAGAPVGAVAASNGGRTLAVAVVLALSLSLASLHALINAIRMSGYSVTLCRLCRSSGKREAEAWVRDSPSRSPSALTFALAFDSASAAAFAAALAAAVAAVLAAAMAALSSAFRASAQRACLS